MFDRYVGFHAKARPYAPAVSTLHGDVTYRMFDENIDRIASALIEASAPSARLVAVRLADPYAHWLAVLALARLGVASASFGAYQGDQVLAVLAPDLVVTDSPSSPPGGDPSIHASADWVADVLRRPLEVLEPRRIDPDALARVVTSSGTTGSPKRMAVSWAAYDAQMRRVALQTGVMNGLSRTLVAIGPESGALQALTATWALGGTAVIGPPAPAALAASLGRLRPTGLVMAPIQLKMLLDALPPDFTPMPDLYIGVTGSHTPAAVRQATRLRLTPNLFIAYASSEAGAIAQAHAAQLGGDTSASGWVQPWAQAEIVDEQDVPVAPGVMGRVRVRSLDSHAGYLDDPAATAESFRDGWFYPGDLGSLDADGMLRIHGRVDEIMNLGGEKVLPHVLEDAAIGCPGVVDAGAFVAPDGDGVGQPWLAVVRGEGLDEGALAKALARPGLPPVHVAWIEQIPRNALGKVHRDQLQGAARALVAGQPR